MGCGGAGGRLGRARGGGEKAAGATRERPAAGRRRAGTPRSARGRRPGTCSQGPAASRRPGYCAARPPAASPRTTVAWVVLWSGGGATAGAGAGAGAGESACQARTGLAVVPPPGLAGETPASARAVSVDDDEPFAASAVQAVDVGVTPERDPEKVGRLPHQVGVQDEVVHHEVPVPPVGLFAQAALEQRYRLLRAGN